MIVAIILILIAVLAIAIFRNGYEKYVNKISFKETLDLVGVPIVTFKNNNKKFNFILDTGASKSVIDSNILNKLEYNELDVQSSVFGMEGNTIKCSFVDVPLYYHGCEFNEEFQSVNMKQTFDQVKSEFGVQVVGILGSSFLSKYDYVLDFDKLVAYCKNKKSKK